MKKLLALLMIVIVVAIVVVGGSPYYAAYQLKTAYDDTDGATIAAAIDYQRVRPSIEAQLSDRFTDTLTQYPLITQLGGEALAQTGNDFIHQAVDGAITAQNIERLIDTGGQANAATKKLAAAWAIASNQVDLRELIQALIAARGDLGAVLDTYQQRLIDQPVNTMARADSNGDQPDLRYCGINCFEIVGEVKGYPLTVEMAREGLITWRVVDVVLP